MVSVTLTPKTMNATKTTPLIPDANIVVLPPNNNYVELPFPTTPFTLVPTLNNFFCIKFRFKNTTVPASPTLNKFELRKADGTTVIATSADVTVATANVYQNQFLGLFKALTLADYVGMRLFWKSSNTIGTITIEQNSVVMFEADQKNLMDDLGVKRQIDDIKIFSMGTSEGVNGFFSTNEDADFTTIPINSLMSNIIFSGNSGNTLFSWSGNLIGLEV